jgi:hypothetical protein
MLRRRPKGGGKMRRRSGRPTRGWLAILSGAVALGAALASGTRGGARDVADAWTTLIEAADQGDAAAPLRSRRGARLTARQAYLLAFHEAQDAADPEHVLAVGDRLDAIGDGALAGYVRRAARSLLVELGARSDAAAPDDALPP